MKGGWGREEERKGKRGKERKEGKGEERKGKEGGKRKVRELYCQWGFGGVGG